MTTMKDDIISRAAVLDFIDSMNWCDEISDEAFKKITIHLENLPPTQPNLSEAYSKAVFTWLMDYQIRAAELKGRYTPYEVLSWVISDWRKENE